MREDRYHGTEGVMVVALLPTRLIQQLLQEGISIHGTPEMGVARAEVEVRQRLELELEIRRMGLR